MAEVYEMMMKLNLEHTALMAGLASIATKLQGLHGQAGALKNAFIALGAGFAVSGLVKSFEEIAKAGGEVNHQMNMMKSIGMTTTEMTAAMAQAQRTAYNVPTTDITENLKHLQEIRYIMGGASEANKYLDSLSRINSIITNIKGDNKDQVFDLAKSLEIKNLTPDPKEFMAYANAMLQSIQASGGKITAAQFRNAIQYGRVAAMGWDKDFISGALGRLIQEYSSGGGGGAGGGSGGPGNALMSAYQTLIQGKMTKQAAYQWEQLGFNNPRWVGIDKAHGRDLAMTHPYEWVQQYLMPALAAKGKTDNKEIISIISQLFGIRTAAGIMTNMALGGRFHLPGFNAEGDPNSPFEKDIRLKNIAEGDKAYDRLIKEDYPMIIESFHHQWKSLLETIGGPLMAPDGLVIKGMVAFRDALAETNKFFSDHPEAIKLLVAGMIGLTGALVALGGAAVVAVLGMLGTGGIIAAGIAGLVSVLGGLAIMEWDKIKYAAESIAAVGKALFNLTPLGLGLKLWRNFSAPYPERAPELQPQRFEGDGFTRNNLIRVGNGSDGLTGNNLINASDQSIIPPNFSPGEKKQILQPIQLDLNVDGRTLAQCVSEILEDLYTHSSGAPSSNGWNKFRPAGQYSDT